MEKAYTYLELCKEFLERVEKELNAKKDKVVAIYGYDIKSCPDRLLKKFLETHEDMASLNAYLEVQKEQERREFLKIEIKEK